MLTCVHPVLRLPVLRILTLCLATLRENLLTLAAWLHLRNRVQVLGHPILRRLPGLNLLDYLIYNDDRQWNLGTIRTSARELRLFPIDFATWVRS